MWRGEFEIRLGAAALFKGRTTVTATEATRWQGRLPFFYGWIIVGLGFVTAFYGIGLTWAVGLLAVPMHAELGWSRSAIFFAASLRGWMGIAIVPLIGSYLDRRGGPRLLAIAGGVINTAALVLIGFMHAASHWRHDRRGRMARLLGDAGGARVLVRHAPGSAAGATA